MRGSYSYLIIYLFFFTFYFQNSQAQTTYDVFPLSKGLYYKYNFHQRFEHWELFSLALVYSDSGTVAYSVLDSIKYGDTLTVWNIEQRQNLIHYYQYGNDTVGYNFISDTSYYDLKEYLVGNHELKCSSLVWSFPLIIDPYFWSSFLTNSDSSVYHFSNLPDFTKIRSYEIICAGWVDSVWFSNEKGMYRRVSDYYWQCGISSDFYTRNVELIDGPNSINQDYLNIPDNFTLYQNYPNPFNPTTKIKYEIPDQARNNISIVTLKVYDILGREVSTLVNEEKPVGEYEVEFSGSGLTSGIYFYMLQSGEYVETKKMVLLK